MAAIRAERDYVIHEDFMKVLPAVFSISLHPNQKEASTHRVLFSDKIAAGGAEVE